MLITNEQQRPVRSRSRRRGLWAVSALALLLLTGVGISAALPLTWTYQGDSYYLNVGPTSGESNYFFPGYSYTVDDADIWALRCGDWVGTLKRFRSRFRA